MKFKKFEYLLITLVILLAGCSELLTAPDGNNITDRPTTTIAFVVFEPSHILLYITNYNFELVKVLVDEELNCGNHSVVWNGRDYNEDPVSSGVYYYFIVSDDYAYVKQMLLIK